MSVVYRSIFTDPRPRLISEGRGYFESWLGSKGINIELPRETASVIDVAGTGKVSVTTANENGVEAVRYRLDEEHIGERWSSTLTLIAAQEEQWVWLDVERVSEDAFGIAPLVAPPRIIRDFLTTSPTLAGTTPLRPECVEIDETGVDQLISELTDTERTIPILVVSKDRFSPTGARERGNALIQVLRGVANVWVLEGFATSELSKQLGSDLHVYGGAVRTYLPGLTIPDREPRRHRFARRELFIEDPRRGARAIGRSLLSMAASTRPPAIYREVVHEMPGFSRRGHDDEDLLTELVTTEERMDGMAAALASANNEAREDKLRADRAEARVKWLENQLAASGDFLAGVPTPGEEEIISVESCVEALIFADAELSLIEIGDTEEPAAAIDRHSKGPMWARKAWSALLALQSYASAKSDNSFQGNFLSYCQASFPPGYRISADWVAQAENETVNNNPTYRRARMFQVPSDVNAEGVAYMDQHIRLEKGSDPAPRIHFYDDTAGNTGRIYIGYLGRHLPSGQTN